MLRRANEHENHHFDSRPLFRGADRLAKRLGIPRSRLYSRAIERYISEAEERDVIALLNKLYEDGSSQLDPVLEALQALVHPARTVVMGSDRGIPKAFCPWQ